MPKRAPSPESNRAAIPTDHELDVAFEGARHTGAGAAGEGTLNPDAHTVADLKSLFAKIASDHTGPLRDFQLELADTETGRQWGEICRPAVDTLLKGALRLGHDELARALEEYAKVLAAALEGNGSTMISGQARQDLLGAYEDLRAAAPDAFDLSAERDRREPVIIDSLLEQTPGLTRQAIYRVYAAGVNRLRAFYQATPEELAATTGVDKEVCEKILARFDAYRRRRAEGSPGEGPETALDRLASVVRDLQRTDEQFRGIDEYGDRRRRRELRGQRQALVHEVDITLAQLGEVELLEQLKRFPVDRKIQRIQRYLRQPRMT